MSIVAALIFAAVSPLASPSDYVFAPFANESNAVSFIKGEIMGKDADYKSIRAEDLAFLQEAFCERRALSVGIFSEVTNNVDGLRIGDYSSFIIQLSEGTGIYLDSVAELPSGIFMCDFGSAKTNVDVQTWNTTNVSDIAVVPVTNWTVGVTNTFRADWPAVRIPHVHFETNITYAVTNVLVTNVTYKTWRECVTTNESVFTQTNSLAISGTGWGPRENIPYFVVVTNMYKTLARGKYLLNSSAQYDTSSNRYDEVKELIDYSKMYVNESTDIHKVDWVEYTSGPTNRHYITPGKYLVGEVYSMGGSASKYAVWGYYYSGDDILATMSQPCITYQTSESYPSNNNSVAERIISHITVDVATRGNHNRIKSNVRIYHPVRLDYSEYILNVTPTHDGDTYSYPYRKTGTAYGMACADGLCDFSGTNRVTITTAIDIKPIYSSMAVALGLLYTTPGSIVPYVLQDPIDASYQEDGETIYVSTSSSLVVNHSLSLIGNPIILYTCDFSAEVN